MKLLTTLILLVNISFAQPVDSLYRKVFITVQGGANTLYKSPFIGATLDLEITDKDYPIVINWESGFNLFQSSQAINTSLGFGIRKNNIDFGITPFGFIAIRKDEFIPVMSCYLRITKSPRINFKLSGNYNFCVNSGFGFTGTLNYKIRQLKKL